MTREPSDRLKTAAWLREAELVRVFDVLAGTGATSRVVGGAVRNTLLGLAVDDIDIATTATPQQVLDAATRANLGAFATGLQHGTVTLVATGHHYEVTTLRKDVATDGRHATVAFTDDWHADASRRDFTVNALYCDPDGTLFDPLGGVADFAPVRIRFIGDARARIREDYLRILRFFRFSARYGDGAVDAEGLAACGAERDGLKRVSAERIRTEFLKLLATRRAAEMCRTLQAHGFLVALLGMAPSTSRLGRLIDIETSSGRPADPVLRLAGLTMTPGSDAERLAQRLRLSNVERGRLQTIAADLAQFRALPSDSTAKKVIYQRGEAVFRDLLLVAWAASNVATDDAGWRRCLAIADTWTRPVLPVNGRDVLALGVPGGALVGRLLDEIETWWINRDFVPDRQACLDELAHRAHA